MMYVSEQSLNVFGGQNSLDCSFLRSVYELDLGIDGWLVEWQGDIVQTCGRN